MKTKSDKKYIVNSASKKKIQSSYRKVILEIQQMVINCIDDNLLSIIIRGSVSVGRAKIGLSDIDMVVVTKNKLTKNKLNYITRATVALEKKYPKYGLIDLTILTSEELIKSKTYNRLRVYLKTQSVCLWGKDIVKQLPNVEPGRQLALNLYGNLSTEIMHLKKIFSGEISNPQYLGRKKPIKFWCVWMSRVLLRSGLGLVMLDKPIYMQDLKKCHKYFTYDFPEYKKEADQLLKWAVKPTSKRDVLIKFLNNYSSKYLLLWSKKINN